MVNISESNQYFIFYQSGTGGHLIASVLYKMLVDDTVELRLSPHGHAHRINMKLGRNYDDTTSLFSKWDYTIPKYKCIKPIQNDKPFILPDHCLPDWNELNSYFPGFKGIKIIYNNNDIKNIIPLQFYKVKVDCFNEIVSDNILQEWIGNLRNSNNFYKNYDSFNNNVFNIEFDKILSDLDYTLSFISNITKRSVSESTINFYKKWMETTKNTIQKYNNLYGSIE